MYAKHRKNTAQNKERMAVHVVICESMVVGYCSCCLFVAGEVVVVEDASEDYCFDFCAVWRD